MTNNVIIKIKILDHAKDLGLPSYQTEGSSGMDIMAAIEKDILLTPDMWPILIPTGFAIKIKKGYEAQIRSRSGLAYKNGIIVTNSPGTIDSDYTGEVKVILSNAGRDAYLIKRGDRIAQMVISRTYRATLEEEETLEETERAANGFGSTGI